MQNRNHICISLSTALVSTTPSTKLTVVSSNDIVWNAKAREEVSGHFVTFSGSCEEFGSLFRSDRLGLSKISQRNQRDLLFANLLLGVFEDVHPLSTAGFVVFHFAGINVKISEDSDAEFIRRSKESARGKGTIQRVRNWLKGIACRARKSKEGESKSQLHPWQFSCLGIVVSSGGKSNLQGKRQSSCNDNRQSSKHRNCGHVLVSCRIRHMLANQTHHLLRAELRGLVTDALDDNVSAFSWRTEKRRMKMKRSRRKLLDNESVLWMCSSHTMRDWQCE